MLISRKRSSTCSTTVRARVSVDSPVLRSISERMSSSAPYRARASRIFDSSIARNTSSGSISFSRANRINDLQQFEPVCTRRIHFTLFLSPARFRHPGICPPVRRMHVRCGLAGSSTPSECCHLPGASVARATSLKSSPIVPCGISKRISFPSTPRRIPLKSPLSVDQLLCLDPGAVAGPGIKIPETGERAVNPGAGHFERVFSCHRVFDIEQCRQCFRDLGAVIDVDPTVPVGPP